MILGILFWVLFLFWLLCCAILVLVILNQEPKGGGVGAMFGQGSFMGEALGVSGITATLRRITTTAASAFMVLSILLAVMAPAVYRADVGAVPPPVAAVTGDPASMTFAPETSDEPIVLAVDAPDDVAPEAGTSPAPEAAAPTTDGATGDASAAPESD